MRQSLMFIAMAIAIALTTLTAEARPPKVGDPMPGFKDGVVFNNDEYNVDLNDTKGFVTVVEFWATWCGPCKRAIPHLVDLHKRHADDGLLIVGISTEESKTVKPFVKSHHMEYIVLADAGGTSKMYGASRIPHAFVVDAKGIVTWVGNPLDGGFDTAINKALKDTPPTRKLGGGPEHNERVITNAEAAMAEGNMDEAYTALRRIDVEAIPQGNGHMNRLASLMAIVDPIAQSQYDLAVADLNAGQYVQALAEFEHIKATYIGMPTPYGTQAERQLQKLKTDPDVIQAKRLTVTQKAASNMLKRAKKQAKRGDDEAAYRKLLALVEKYPNTAAESEAEKLLTEYEADADFISNVVDKEEGR